MGRDYRSYNHEDPDERIDDLERELSRKDDHIEAQAETIEGLEGRISDLQANLKYAQECLEEARYDVNYYKEEAGVLPESSKLGDMEMKRAR